EQNGNLFVDSLQEISVYIDGRRVDMENGRPELLHYWVPRISASCGGAAVDVTLLAPKDSRGFIYNLIFNSPGKKHIRVVRKFTMRSLKLCINKSYRLDTRVRRAHDNWFDQDLIDIYMGKPILCLAFGADKKCSRSHKAKTLKFTYEFECDGSEEINLYTAAGMEEMAAMSVNAEFERRGFTKYFEEMCGWLGKRVKKFKDPDLERVYNINLFFNYFFASGVTIDTQETVCVTSRSPEYYVSAAYWDRDALLWSFPAVMLADMERARDILEYAFKAQGKNFGIHSRFMNGNTLECGFELDELAAPFIALGSYLNAGGERQLPDKDYIKDKIMNAGRMFDRWMDEATGLYLTELRPSDDMIKYPLNTYDNVLVWKAFLSLAGIHKNAGRDKEAALYMTRASGLKKAIMKYAVIKKAGIFAYEFDGRGNFELYEEPPGSLKLLHHYGFIDKTNGDVYAKTLKWIYSEKNPYFFAGKWKISECGCGHAAHPWTLSACNSLLTPGYEKFGRDYFKNAVMDGYVASESVFEKDGTAATGKDFATCSGFVAYAIHQCFYGKYFI
ncbi:MAG: glycoside hydrolase family 125 protein, partial [Spirochaetia bacterium]|nr:glycoside hydrolase family 125 protein [Spirochaetia bacterium]